MEEQLEVMGARRWAGHSLAAPDSLGQKVEQAHHLKSRRRARKRSLRRTKYHAWDVCRVAAKLTHFIKWVWQNE